MKNLRLVGGLAATAVLLILLLAAAAPALAADLPLVSSTTYPTALDDAFTCVTTAGGGVVYAAGYAQRDAAETQGRLLLVKYLDDGTSLTEVWHKLIVKRGSAVALAVDSLGNVIVAGDRGSTTAFHGNGCDIVVYKYSADGVLDWASAYDGPKHGIDYVRAMALDVHGNVVVCGSSFGGRTGRDYVTLKLKATSGKRMWVRGYAGPSDFDVATDVAVDPSGNVYVTGASRQKASVPNLSGPMRTVTIGYGGAGRVRWMRSDTAARNSWGTAVDWCGVGGEKSVIVSGSRLPRGQHQSHLFFEKYRATDGRATWLATLDEKTKTDSWPEAGVVDATGAPVAAGIFRTQDGYVADLAGVSAAGAAPWSSLFASTFDNPAWAEFAGLAIGADGRLLAAGNTVTGEMPEEGDQPTTFLVRYSPALPVTAPLDYVGAGSATTEDSCSAVAIGDKGMYAVGKTGTAGNDSDAVLLKF